MEKQVNFLLDEKLLEGLRELSAKRFSKANISVMLRTLVVDALREAGLGE